MRNFQLFIAVGIFKKLDFHNIRFHINVAIEILSITLRYNQNRFIESNDAIIDIICDISD